MRSIKERKLLWVFALAALGLIGYGAVQVLSPTTSKWEGHWVEESDYGKIKFNLSLTAYPNGSIRGTLRSRQDRSQRSITGSLDSSGKLHITIPPETTTAQWQDVRVDFEGHTVSQRNQMEATMSVVYPTAQQLQEWGVRSDDVVVGKNGFCIPELGVCFPMDFDGSTVNITLRKVY